MKKVLLFSGALLALTASMALAGSVNFSWTQCIADAGLQNRTFACNSNSGTNVAIGTFTLDNELTDFVGVEVVVDLQSANALPAWWQFFNAGACRGTAISATFDFSVLAGGCADPFGQPGTGGVAAYCVLGANCVDAPETNNRARVKAAGAVADPTPISAGTEYYGVRFAITNAKTVGTGACAGCTEPVCLVLNSIKAAGLSGGAELNTDGNLAGTDNFITWQGGAIGGLGCPLATPTQNKTWGQVKSLYRN
jgi:hypothetical protein